MGLFVLIDTTFQILVLQAAAVKVQQRIVI